MFPASRLTKRARQAVSTARPRVPRFQDRPPRDQAHDVLTRAKDLGEFYAGRGGIHPLDNVDHHNPRPGLRRWVAVNTATGVLSRWREAWASVHHDGSVTLAAPVGGHRMSSDEYLDGWQVESAAIECAVADQMALLRTAAETTDNIRLGIEWAGSESLSILTVDNLGYLYGGVSTPPHRYTPVETTVNAAESDLDFYRHVHDLAQDCVNQGVSNVRMIRPPDPTEQQ